MGASLTTQRRVEDEDLRVVNSFRSRRMALGLHPEGVTVPREEAPANSVPAAAVIRGGQALFGITGRKGLVGGQLSHT